MAQTSRSNVRYVDPQRRYTVVLGPSWNAPFGALPHDDRAGTHDRADGRCGSYASIGHGQASSVDNVGTFLIAVRSHLESGTSAAAGDGASRADGLTARCHSGSRWAPVAMRDFGWAEDRNGSRLGHSAMFVQCPERCEKADQAVRSRSRGSAPDQPPFHRRKKMNSLPSRSITAWAPARNF
jgi:hypothetical protein